MRKDMKRFPSFYFGTVCIKAVPFNPCEIALKTRGFAVTICHVTGWGERPRPAEWPGTRPAAKEPSSNHHV
ncbi:hypothetical protein TELCIR_07792 [Teladorsagia circumcincta]|uniref:Uncharacterized protein n=1 Tax=Teladorsagia circumcincta TaxID=45464 RepID=A0A2G9UJD4_TELCI|nr:hypothetical protein TELCIR_07792 [Teladorsagia circumcincta]